MAVTSMGELSADHYDITTESQHPSAHEALVKSAKFGKKGLPSLLFFFNDISLHALGMQIFCIFQPSEKNIIC